MDYRLADFYRRCIRITALDSPNVRLALHQQARGSDMNADESFEVDLIVLVGQYGASGDMPASAARAMRVFVREINDWLGLEGVDVTDIPGVPDQGGDE